jgi:UDP-N-acetylmuramoyl-tripeptide--D-alanyl-D-alanine ligase
MKALSIEEILKATCGELLCGDDRGFSGVSIDSRSISDGEIFFALRGERFDGHDFIEDALKKGSGAVVDKRPAILPEGRVVIKVSDTLKALQELAHFYRKRLKAVVIAITGSNGKTTTKEMTYTVLSKRFRCVRNEGNLNNHIGLPLSILRVPPDSEVVVLELGMNARGEIRRLCEIAMPEHGVVTNIGTAHIGRLGGIEAIRDAKLEIINGLKTLIANADDEFLMDGVRDFGGRLITFSISNSADVMAGDIVRTEEGSTFKLRWKGKEVDVRLGLYGIFNIYNALAASAAGLCLGMDMDEIKDGLEVYHAFPMRFDVMKRDGLTIINDSYNANPTSIHEALNELVTMKGKKRAVAILGDMYELGDYAEDAHRDIGRQISNMDIDEFVAVGEMMSLAADEALKNRSRGVHVFKDVEEAKGHIREIIMPDDIVLIKGSRLVGMERLLEVIRDAI